MFNSYLRFAASMDSSSLLQPTCSSSSQRRTTCSTDPTSEDEACSTPSHGRFYVRNRDLTEDSFQQVVTRSSSAVALLMPPALVPQQRISSQRIYMYSNISDKHGLRIRQLDRHGKWRRRGGGRYCFTYSAASARQI